MSLHKTVQLDETKSAEQALTVHRQIAAEASAGISNDTIYLVFIKLLRDLDFKGDILDFGAGVGTLTQHLAKLRQFSSITAVDIMRRPSTVPDSVRWISGDLNENIDIESNSFDVIVAAEVVEHLENPRAVSREWFRVLRSGGTLILSTPNNESLRALLALVLRGHFVDFGENSYPAHITALLRKDIERILMEAGFSTPKFVFSNVGGIPKLPRVHWQEIAGRFLRGLRFSDNLFAIATKNVNGCNKAI